LIKKLAIWGRDTSVLKKTILLVTVSTIGFVQTVLIDTNAAQPSGEIEFILFIGETVLLFVLWPLMLSGAVVFLLKHRIVDGEWGRPSYTSNPLFLWNPLNCILNIGLLAIFFGLGIALGSVLRDYESLIVGVRAMLLGMATLFGMLVVWWRNRSKVISRQGSKIDRGHEKGDR
jgi:hypothetical protein